MVRHFHFLCICLLFALMNGSSAQAMSDDERHHLRRLNVFFNTIGNLEGDFIQVDPRGRESTGKFYMKRPGKMLFRYQQPLKQSVLSDGSWVQIQGADGREVDRFPLLSTPLRFLLRDRVDLMKDAAITDIQASDDALSVTMKAKKPVTPGKLVLNFGLPAYNLLSWSVVDPKGQTTRVAIGNLEFGKDYADKHFRIKNNKRFNSTTGRFE